VKKAKGFIVGLIAGCMLMFTMTTFAATVKQYILTKAAYPVFVNGLEYQSEDLPMLNYQGSTYIPMRAVGDMLGATVEWNAELGRAEIHYIPANHEENTAFRNIKISGSDGVYKVTGEARVFEAVMQYAVSDGHSYLLEKSHTLQKGAPAWSAFTLNISIPKEKLPVNGTLTIELFEYSAKDGSPVNVLIKPLESFPK